MPAKQLFPTLKLNDGAEIPVLALGTFQSDDEQKLVIAIKEAIKAGYRHIDGAWAYQNEKGVGRAIKEAIAESNGTLKREDIWITSKLWNSFHSKEQARIAIKQTLDNLNLEYVDLYLIHWPTGLKEKLDTPFPSEFSDVHYLETWEALEEFHKEGKAKHIGVSNFSVEQIQDVLDKCKVKPVINQFEVNPYCQNDKLIDFCQKNGVAVEGYAPFGAGKDLEGKDGKKLPSLFDHPDLKEIGKKYNKTPAQIIIRWGIQRNVIVLAKSITPERIVKNSEVFDFKLTDEDMQKIKGINENVRAYPENHLVSHPFYPFHEDINKKDTKSAQ